MKYLYCSITNAFYPYSLIAEYKAAGIWPVSGVDIDEEVFALYVGEPPVGKVRGSIDGMPAWVDAPPPPELTHEQVVLEATEKRHHLKLSADYEIGWRQDAVDGGYAEPEEVTELAAWKKYRVRLMRIDTSKAPDIEWPVAPE